ncbi:MAG: hypothetical protein WCT48_02915 [Candidatus Paceibacterota bacterium]
METPHSTEYKNALKSEHLNKGIKPIIACVDTYDNMEDLGEFEELLFSDDTREVESVNFYANPEKLAEKDFKNAGYQTYVISAIDNTDKFSKTFGDCTGTVVTGQDKETKEDISFVSHEEPNFFTKEHPEKFSEDFRLRLQEIKKRCIPGTIDAVIMGGNYYVDVVGEEFDNNHRDNYRNSIDILSKEISDVLGFEPPIITGPKLSGGEDHILYRNGQRRLHVLRPQTGKASSESYLPKDFAEQEKKWEKEGGKNIGTEGKNDT